MKIKLNGNNIELEDNIEALEMNRYSLFNKYILLDSGIGSDLTSVNEHINKMYVYINKSKTEELKKELINLHQNIKFAVQNVDPKSLAFACMVKKINNKEYKFVDEEIIKEIQRSILIKTKAFQINEYLEALKKKLIFRLKHILKVRPTKRKKKQYTGT